MTTDRVLRQQFQQARFLVLTGGSDEVIPLHPDGVQRHHGEWRVRPLDDLESNLRELKSALALMTECDWRTPGCKTCQEVSKRLTLCGMQRTRSPATVPDTMCLLRQRNDFWTLVMTTSQNDRKILWYRADGTEAFLWIWCETFEPRSNPSC